jgi:hypothetical protein
MWITKKEYDSEGAGIVHKKCFWDNGIIAVNEPIIVADTDTRDNII